MTHTIRDRTYLNRAVRSRNAWLAFLLAVVSACGALGFFNVTGLIKDLTSTYTSTSGEVVDEGTHRVLTGSRRSRHFADRRHVVIMYELDGVSTQGRADSTELQIGDPVAIWVNDRTGEIRTEEPSAPGFWNWTWAIVVPIIALLLLCGFIVGVRTSIRLMLFSPRGREPDFVFVLTNVDATETGGRAKRRRLILHGVMQANSIADRVGQPATLTAAAKQVPPAQKQPTHMIGYYLRPGREESEPVLHIPELDAWWTALLTFPRDLEVSDPQSEATGKSS